ncbi:hypothetical protein [Streptomyces sp. NPDC097981]|uniref:hypothetical protein n=1 Tax=Streptomyces sp. NPDC097981 TaxID=3155428 RepID=UPI003328DD65
MPSAPWGLRRLAAGSPHSALGDSSVPDFNGVVVKLANHNPSWRRTLLRQGRSV